MQQLFDLRALLVTGKGGVGKTTVSAAMALAASRMGKRVLCAEISPDARARSALGEALGVGDLAEEPRLVADNLHCAQLSPFAGHRRFLHQTLPVKLLADAALRSSAVRRFLGAAPAFAEMGVLYQLLDLARARRPDGSELFELLIVDMPATGHTLALTQVPEVVLKLLPQGPIGRAAREGIGLLTDPTRCRAVVVTLPETLPVSESLELTRNLAKGKVAVAGLVLNRVPQNPFTQAEREAVDQMLAEVGPVLGERALGRVDRARDATARLHAQLELPVKLVPELPLSGPGRPLVSALAEHWSSPSGGGEVAQG